MGCLDLLRPFCQQAGSQPERMLILWKDTKDIPGLLDPADPEGQPIAGLTMLWAMADCTV